MIRNFFNQRRIYIVFFISLSVLLILVSSLIRRDKRQNAVVPKELQQVQSTNSNTPIKTESILIQSNDIKNIKDDYIRRTGNVDHREAEPHFTYELAPSLRKRKISPSSVLGVSSCTLENAPNTVEIYSVLTHLNQEEASNVATEYGIQSEPYSLPTETSSYQYFFSGDNNSSFLSVYEPSGAYVFHKASSPSATLLTSTQLRSIADGLLTQHNLSAGIKFVTTRDINDLKEFIYNHPFGKLPNVDSNSLKALNMDKSICNVEESLEMGKIEISLLPDGSLYKLINNTRKTVTIKSAHRIDLEDSIDQYEDNMIYPPLVIPDGSTKSGKVVLDEATIIYFDYGKNFPQKFLMPVYAVSGKITDSTGKMVRVIAMLPAVDADELINFGILKSEVKSKGKTSQKQSTFYYEKPTVPPPPPNARGTGKCFGNQVDYTVSCSQNGQYVCSSFFALQPDEDNLDVCNVGCKSLSGTVNTNGDDPCRKFLDDKDIKTDKYKVGTLNHINIKGDVSCVINACPC